MDFADALQHRILLKGFPCERDRYPDRRLRHRPQRHRVASLRIDPDMGYKSQTFASGGLEAPPGMGNGEGEPSRYLYSRLRTHEV